MCTRCLQHSSLTSSAGPGQVLKLCAGYTAVAKPHSSSWFEFGEVVGIKADGPEPGPRGQRRLREGYITAGRGPAAPRSLLHFLAPPAPPNPWGQRTTWSAALVSPFCVCARHTRPPPSPRSLPTGERTRGARWQETGERESAGWAAPAAAAPGRAGGRVQAAFRGCEAGEDGAPRSPRGRAAQPGARLPKSGRERRKVSFKPELKLPP